MLLTFPFMQNQPTKQHKDELRIRILKHKGKQHRTGLGGREFHILQAIPAFPMSWAKPQGLELLQGFAQVPSQGTKHSGPALAASHSYKAHTEENKTNRT